MVAPTILLIPGSFCPPTLYTNITNALSTHNLNATALSLLTVGNHTTPPASMYDDAASVAASIYTLADEGKDVVVVAHSYGGVVATEAIKGLGKEQRRKEGKSGGVVRVAYMTAFAPREGMSSTDANAELEPPAQDTGSVFLGDDGYLYLDIPKTAPLVFNDLPESRGLALTAEFQPHSARSFADKTTYAGYKDVPVSYLFCTRDMVIPPQLQKIQIENVRRSGTEINVKEVVSGHFPSASHLDDVVEWILEVVGSCEG